MPDIRSLPVADAARFVEREVAVEGARAGIAHFKREDVESIRAHMTVETPERFADFERARSAHHEKNEEKQKTWSHATSAEAGRTF